MSRRSVGTALGVALMTATACGSSSSPTSSSTGPSGAPFSVSATLSDGPRYTAKAGVIWGVATGVDYSFAYGGGDASGTSATVSFPGTPPAAALNSGRVGVGTIVVTEAAAAFGEGRVPANQRVPDNGYVSADYAVIYRASSESVFSWDASFPVGFACGRCDRQSTGFDKFVVVPCSEVRLVPASGANGCNWT